jgi:acyl-coenzyme A synthetase/AMP-(fatty) acid ligase
LVANIWFACVSGAVIMSEMVDFLNLLRTPRAVDAVVGRRADAIVRHGDFVARVRGWQATLQQTPGSRVALYFSESIEFAAALFGAWHAGKSVYLPSDALPATCAALQRVVNGFVGEFPADCAPIAWSAAVSTTDESVALDPDFAGLVVYTSGSTGAPQAIPKKLSQLATEVATLEALFGPIAGNADVVATVSHQHIYGLLFKVLWPLSTARAIHARSLSFPEELAQACAARDCILVSSPAHLKRLPDSPAWAASAHRIRAVFSSGGPLLLDVVRATDALLARVPIEVYGSSETGGVAWRQRFPDADESWTLMPGVASRIEPDDGVLAIRSPHLPDANWFRTADRAQAAGTGRFVLQGRADRIVKLEEKRISLDLIEAQLMQSALVSECRVLVIDGRRDRLAAFVVLSAEGSKLLDSAGKHTLNSVLREHLAHAVERIALPRSWRYLDAMPVNAQGKTTHAELQALLDESARADQRLPQRRLLERDAQRAVYELLAPKDLLYFDGHFHGAPILPGVVQVDWALALGRENFDLPPVFRAMQALKFQQVIRPDMPFTLELLHDPLKSSLAFRYYSAAGPHASGRLLFGAADV